MTGVRKLGWGSGSDHHIGEWRHRPWACSLLSTYPFQVERKEGWLTIAVHNLLSLSDVLCCPDGGDSTSEGHTRVGAAGVVQEADDREDACGKADLPAVGHDALFRP